MRKYSWLMSALASGLLVVACQQSASKPVKAPLTTEVALSSAVIHKSPNDDRTYASLTLPNQLQVVLVSDPSLENSAASLAVGVGSAQDPDKQLGLAHYLEHMLFLGTQKYPIPDNFMEFVQNSAGTTNAFTAFDRTNYLFQINASKFEEALDRYSDYFKAPLLDPQYGDKERNAVNSEWSMNHGQDSWILQELDGKTANPANPRSRFTIGNLETLVDKKDSKLQDELKAFYNRYYSANNMRLTLVGKQSIPELKALAEKYFSSVPNKNVERPKISAPGLTSAEMGKTIHYKSVKDLKKLYVDFPIANNKAEWRLKASAFALNLITSEEEGTLGEQLRKIGLANNVTAGVSEDEYGNDGYLRVQVDLTEVGLKKTDHVIAAIFSYIDLVKKEGVKDIYFRELKAMRAKDFLNAPKPDPLNQAITLSMSQFELPVEHLLDADYVYDEYNEAAITRFLAQLEPTKARIWYINQNEKADTTIPFFDGQYAVNNITADEQKRWSDLGEKLQFKLPPPNNLFTDKPADLVKSDYLKPHQVVSQKGVEAYLAQPEFYREDKGQLWVELNVDFAEKTAKNVVLSTLLSDIFKTSHLTLIDRAERASLKITLEPSKSHSQVIGISGYTTKHETLLVQLLGEFKSLKVSEKEFVEALDRFKEAKANSKKAPPFRQAFAHVRRLVGGAKWTDAELLAAAKAISLNDVTAYHHAVTLNPLIRIYAFGNYSEDSIKHIATTATKTLPGTRLPVQRKVATYLKPVAGQQLAYNEVIEQTDVALVDGYFSDKKTFDERAHLVVLNAIFGNAFFSQLRTNEQLGYVVGSSPVPMDDLTGFVMFVQSTNTDLVGVKARMDKFREEFLAQLKSIEPAQIEQIKMAEAASITQKPTDFFAESTRYMDDFWFARYDFDSRERYLAALAKVNKESLIALYQRVLLDKQATHLLVQLKGTTFANKPYAGAKP